MTFYKFTSIPTAKVILENETMRWSSPVVFNDLEECQFVPFTKELISSAHKKYQEILNECAKGNFPPDFDSYSDVTKSIVSVLQLTRGNDAFTSVNLAEIMKRISGNIEDDYRNFVNTALIRCFRMLCVTTEYDNNLMWAHYADQHRGCVLELDDFFINKFISIFFSFIFSNYWMCFSNN